MISETAAPSGTRSGAGISAVEVELPANLRSRLATVLRATLQFSAGLTDLVVHEGRLIHAKTAAGTVPLTSLNIPGADFVVTPEDIKNFLASFLDGQRPSDSAREYWSEAILPKLLRMEPVYRSLPIPADGAGVSGNMRVAILQHGGGKIGMVIRVVMPPPKLETVRLPEPILQRLQKNPRGLLIITGPTASGKTGTALSIIEYLNEHSSGHIETIEDPIELMLPSRGCVITQRQVGTDVATFGAGLTEALRHAPDVILAGEVRDRDAAEAAVMGGETGTLMLVTTHGRSIVGTMRKILALCGDSVSNAMRTVLAGSLIGVVRQELVPHSNGNAYSMVHETLCNTEQVASLIAAGDWGAIDRLCASQVPTEGFWPMRPMVNDLVQRRLIDIKMADMVLTSRRASL